MVTDEMMGAIDMLIEICSNEEQTKGMKSVMEQNYSSKGNMERV